ncbi:MAG: DUF3754 domain-containing protein [Planctomycetia bacterium]|nr:DUF3754 domain-containing protein [Planctomycetia bacterium]
MRLYDRLVKWFLVDEAKLPDLSWLAVREHFIPIFFSDILKKALEDERLTETDRTYFRTFANMLYEHYHLDYHQSALELKKAFAPFDPDSEVEWKPEYSEEYRKECREKFEKNILQFLSACNFCELEQEKLNTILDAPYPGVLSIAVDYRKLDSMRLYYRGSTDTTHLAQKLFILRKSYASKKLKRVFVLARYKEEYDSQIIAKAFRDVSVENLKVVIPEVRLKLPIFDQIKVGGTGLISIVMALYKVFLAAVLTPILFVIVMTGIVSGFIKAVFGFLNSRTKCLKTYSESLYHKSLASNMGAVNLLVEQAETQEVKEAFLAYFILYVLRDENLTQSTLDRRIESWIFDHFGFQLDFEVRDALRKLVDKKLLGMFTSPDDSETYYKVYDLPSALRRLDEMWDNHHSENNTGDASFDQFAGLSALEQVGMILNENLERNPRKNSCKHDNRHNLRRKTGKCGLVPKSHQVQKYFNRKKK